MRKVILAASVLIAAVSAAPGAVGADIQTMQAAENVVNITFYAFEPAEITVPVGSSVTWRNTDDAFHSARSRDGSFDTGYIPAGADARATFPNPGDYGYYCELHPEKTGVVHVG